MVLETRCDTDAAGTGPLEDPPDRASEALDRIVPFDANTPYDMKALLLQAGRAIPRNSRRAIRRAQFGAILSDGAQFSLTVRNSLR